MYGALKATVATTTYSCRVGHNSITAHKLEHVVLSAVFSHVVQRTQRQAEQSEVIVPAAPTDFPEQQRLDDVSAKITELMDAYRSNILSGDLVFGQVAALENELRDLRKARDLHYAANYSPARSLTTSEEIWSEVGGGLFDLSDEDQALALAAELQGVVVKKGERGRAGWGVDALLGRLEFLWRDGTESQVASVSRTVAEDVSGFDEYHAQSPS
ncbi:hypothetical protein BFL35_14795 [Clavibacter michiganensis]|nr:hypothetical protein BFL35_14795 [Clavibacter michiganensis]